MSKNAFLSILGASMAFWFGGLYGLVIYALTALVFVFAGYGYEAAKIFNKGFREGLTQRHAQPKRGVPHLYVVK